MAFKLDWDATSERFFETGVDRGVLYKYNSTKSNDTNYYGGVVWNGLSAVTESPSGAEANDIYADNIKYLTLRSAEDFGATIEAYTYPDEFAECDGSYTIATGVHIGQQTRKKFGFSYRTKIGNDEDGDSYGYKLHLVYGATASPSEKAYQTVNDSPEAITFSWEISTEPITLTGNYSSYKPIAHIEIDSTKVDSDALTELEEMLYGTSSSGTTTDAYMPLPEDVFAIFESAAEENP